MYEDVSEINNGSAFLQIKDKVNMNSMTSIHILEHGWNWKLCAAYCNADGHGKLL